MGGAIVGPVRVSPAPSEESSEVLGFSGGDSSSSSSPSSSRKALSSAFFSSPVSTCSTNGLTGGAWSAGTGRGTVTMQLSLNSRSMGVWSLGTSKAKSKYFFVWSPVKSVLLTVIDFPGFFIWMVFLAEKYPIGEIRIH